jgi:lipopolysaccharide/colanic/teichoic acid biosynthesis glycosyltransferase
LSVCDDKASVACGCNTRECRCHAGQGENAGVQTAPESALPRGAADEQLEAVKLGYSRAELTEVLYRHYRSSRIGRWRFAYKRLLWTLVVGGAQFLKRLFDVSIASALLLALAPLFAAVGLALKLSGGRVLFWQTRVGLWGREFAFPKFRSMVPNAEALRQKILEQNDHRAGVTFKMKNDPRITWIGRIIRRTSIDELPQLWCVLKGDMSLVGPRPPIPSEVAQYTLQDRRRLDIKPGLTCIWQVSGRGDIAFAEQAELDVRYIESQSFFFDLFLLAKTVPAVLFGKGAY